MIEKTDFRILAEVCFVFYDLNGNLLFESSGAMVYVDEIVGVHACSAESDRRRIRPLPSSSGSQRFCRGTAHYGARNHFIVLRAAEKFCLRRTEMR
jgi:hypothetical protein